MDRRLVNVIEAKVHKGPIPSLAAAGIAEVITNADIRPMKKGSRTITLEDVKGISRLCEYLGETQFHKDYPDPNTVGKVVGAWMYDHRSRPLSFLHGAACDEAISAFLGKTGMGRCDVYTLRSHSIPQSDMSRRMPSRYHETATKCDGYGSPRCQRCARPLFYGVPVSFKRFVLPEIREAMRKKTIGGDLEVLRVSKRNVKAKPFDKEFNVADFILVPQGNSTRIVQIPSPSFEHETDDMDMAHHLMLDHLRRNGVKEDIILRIPTKAKDYFVQMGLDMHAETANGQDNRFVTMVLRQGTKVPEPERLRISRVFRRIKRGGV